MFDIETEVKRLSLINLIQVVFPFLSLRFCTESPWKLQIFKVSFQCQKSARSFWKWFSATNMWLIEQLLSFVFWDKSIFWTTLFSKIVPNFVSSVLNLCDKYGKLFDWDFSGTNVAHSIWMCELNSIQSLMDSTI